MPIVFDELEEACQQFFSLTKMTRLGISVNKAGLENPRRHSHASSKYTEKCSFTLFIHLLFTLTVPKFYIAI